MPKLNITINYETPPDVDGDSVRARKTVDMWASLTATQKTAIQGIYERLKPIIEDKYGETARVEAASLEMDA